MRRRPRELVVTGAKIPESVLTFIPGHWQGGSEYQRWAAWDEARVAWAEANLPGGMEDMPDGLLDNLAPDQPWDEVEI